MGPGVFDCVCECVHMNKIGSNLWYLHVFGCIYPYTPHVYLKFVLKTNRKHCRVGHRINDSIRDYSITKYTTQTCCIIYEHTLLTVLTHDYGVMLRN